MTNHTPYAGFDESPMENTPLVSIVIPVFNDEDVISGALDSCLRQTVEDIEIVVVDDASTDGTAAIVEKYVSQDPRVRLIRQEQNASAYQARLVGIRAARAAHLLFLDGDDELAAEAAEVVVGRARATNADLVQFGIDVVRSDGSTGGPFEERLQPRHDVLTGTDVLRGRFPTDQIAQGQLWRYLYRTDLLRDAYALMPEDLVLPRVNDLPITFLAIALAQTYVSVPDRLYRYHFGRGGSGQKVNDIERAKFYAGAIDSIDAIAPAVNEIADRSSEPDLVRATYEAVRRSIIGYTTYYLAEHTREDLRAATFEHLYAKAPAREIVQATATYWPQSLDTLAAHTSRVDIGDRSVRSIMLVTSHLRTGGVSGVVTAQARLFLEAGYDVTIAVRESGSDRSAVPEGANFVEIDETSIAAGLAQWSEVCLAHGIDLVIDHQWLYTTAWPAFALVSATEGAATIGWAHNFAGRSLLLGLNNLEFHRRHLDLLSQLVVLSPLDVSFWKLQGMHRVVYLPNPPSPLLALRPISSEPKPAPSDRRVELVWWGRLNERTKRLSELLTVAKQLQLLNVDFRLRIIGPDWNGMTAERLNELALKNGLSDRIQALGPLYGAELLEAIDTSDIFVSTSLIEGYPLTIPEAQSRGLPVAMYELPWLAVVEDNGGVVTSPMGDASGLARDIAQIVADPDRFRDLSSASLAAAERELSYDFVALYRQLLDGTLPTAHSPEPDIADAQQLIDLVIEFTEHNAATRRRASPAKAQATKTPTADTASQEEPSSLASAVVQRITPVARAVLVVAPGLRTTALKLKHALLRR